MDMLSVLCYMLYTCTTKNKTAIYVHFGCPADYTCFICMHRPTALICCLIVISSDQCISLKGYNISRAYFLFVRKDKKVKENAKSKKMLSYSQVTAFAAYRSRLKILLLDHNNQIDYSRYIQ